MRCKNGHDHPPMAVVGATYNETNQPRPYHCPEATGTLRDTRGG